MAALFSGFVLVRGAARTRRRAEGDHPAGDHDRGRHIAWLSVGAALTRLFRDPRTNRAINVTFAVLLVASVAVALLL